MCAHQFRHASYATMRVLHSALRELSRSAVRVQVPYTQAERSYYVFSRWIQLARSNDVLFFEALVSDEL